MGEGVGEVSGHFPRAIGEIWCGLCHQALDRQRTQKAKFKREPLFRSPPLRVVTPGLEDLCLAGPWGAPHAYQSWSSILRAMRSEAVLSNDEARCFINLGDPWLFNFFCGLSESCPRSRAFFQETNFNAWLPLESGDAIPVCTSGLQESPLSRKTPLWFPKVNGAGQAGPLVAAESFWCLYVLSFARGLQNSSMSHGLLP